MRIQLFAVVEYSGQASELCFKIQKRPISPRI